ncbi:hypothetical protein MKEN_00914900 [Mycena kentingensis (nom. inval.)]|nr:hypothetical protein MKEN_00914900 [Mycena kentingensis (nom. inval.)]
MLANTLFSVLALAGSALSAPTPAPSVGPQELIVVSPTIISPAAGDWWRPGTTHLVTWETDDIPPAAANNRGYIYLGHLTYVHDKKTGEDYPNENLDIDHPLAAGFLITDGCANVTVPKDTKHRNDYFVVLFGDSGNTSQKFAIRP